MRSGGGLGEIGFMDAKKVEAIDYIRQHPGFFAAVTARHVVNMWTGLLVARSEVSGGRALPHPQHVLRHGNDAAA